MQRRGGDRFVIWDLISVCVDEMIIVAITHMHSFRARHINSQEKRKTEKKAFPPPLLICRRLQRLVRGSPRYRGKAGRKTGCRGVLREDRTASRLHRFVAPGHLPAGRHACVPSYRCARAQIDQHHHSAYVTSCGGASRHEAQEGAFALYNPYAADQSIRTKL